MCLTTPITVKDDVEVSDANMFSLYAENEKYEGIYYKLSSVIYDGRYCLRQLDGSLYEIPLPLLEKISGLNLFTPEEYQTITDAKRTWIGEKWKNTAKDDSYLFFSMDRYVILQVLEDEKVELKERGTYQFDTKTIRFYPDGGIPYTFITDLEKMQLISENGEPNGWIFDENGQVFVKYRNDNYFIEQAGSEYLSP